MKEVCVFTQDVTPPPTVNQSCQRRAKQSPLHCYKIWEAHGDAVQSSTWPLHASSGGSAITSHPPYEASDRIFRSCINMSLSQVPQIMKHVACKTGRHMKLSDWVGTGKLSEQYLAKEQCQKREYSSVSLTLPLSPGSVKLGGSLQHSGLCLLIHSVTLTGKPDTNHQ